VRPKLSHPSIAPLLADALRLPLPLLFPLCPRIPSNASSSTPRLCLNLHPHLQSRSPQNPSPCPRQSPLHHPSREMRKS
jgi:hypothetical protein